MVIPYRGTDAAVNYLLKPNLNIAVGQPQTFPAKMYVQPYIRPVSDKLKVPDCGGFELIKNSSESVNDAIFSSSCEGFLPLEKSAGFRSTYPARPYIILLLFIV